MAGKCGKTAGAGRKRGVPNKLTGELKEMILEAANQSHPDGAVGYLKARSQDQPVAFMSLLGRVLPLQGPGPQGEHTLLVGWQEPSE
jgi:hypothetical protein